MLNQQLEHIVFHNLIFFFIFYFFLIFFVYNGSSQFIVEVNDVLIHLGIWDRLLIF